MYWYAKYSLAILCSELIIKWPSGVSPSRSKTLKSLSIYIEPYDTLKSNLELIVIDSDNEKLGNDGFTPLIIEERGFKEFLSVHELQGILINMGYNSDTVIDKILSHIAYYLEYDAYLSENKN